MLADQKMKDLTVHFVQRKLQIKIAVIYRGQTRRTDRPTER